MTNEIRVISNAVAILAGAALLGTSWSIAQSASQAKLPGDAGPGPYVQGCVDCHGKNGAESIGSLLSAMKHKNVDKQTTSVPGDCKECHSADGDYTPLSELSHYAHYQNPGENDFVQKSGGNCLHCHALDAETGVVTLKSGPKNW